MNEIAALALAVVAGAVLGAIFFGGLWWTVSWGIRSSRPALWFLGSLLLRTSMVLGGFYWVGHTDWQRLGACLLGFIVARLLISRLLKPSVENPTRNTQELGHAP
jgi:F1F0 ATPase subunit 2